MEYNFERLEVWKLSLLGIQDIDTIIRKLPKEEQYVLIDQLRSAALSVALNIAEGSGRGSKPDFRRFIRNAIGSTLEVVACMRVTVGKKYLTTADTGRADGTYEKLYFKLIAMEKYLKR